jgi:hypothetical protein
MTASPPSLDLKENNRNSWPCGWRVVVGNETVEGKPQKVYSRVYCKTWGCSYCGPRRARALGESIYRESIAHKLDRSLCLTLDPRKVGDANKFQYIWSVWAKFRVYLTRHLGVTLTYIAVLELQRNGMPHLHILIRLRLKTRSEGNVV